MKRSSLTCLLTITAAMVLASCKATEPPPAAEPSAPPAAASEPPAPTPTDSVSAPADIPLNDRTVYFYYGPLKPMIAEVIINSITAITGHDFGGFDVTAPDPGSIAFVDAGNDSDFHQHCRLLGGCLEHRVPLGRRDAIGTVFAIQLEKAVAEACYDRRAFGMFPGNRAPDNQVGVTDVLEHQFMMAFGTMPDAKNIRWAQAYFDDHLSDPDFRDISPLESAGRGYCRAILASNRFLFY